MPTIRDKQATEAHNLKVMADWLKELDFHFSRALCVCGMDPEGNFQMFAVPGMSQAEVAKYLQEVVNQLRKDKIDPIKKPKP